RRARPVNDCGDSIEVTRERGRVLYAITIMEKVAARPASPGLQVNSLDADRLQRLRGHLPLHRNRPLLDDVLLALLPEDVLDELAPQRVEFAVGLVIDVEEEGAG